MNLTLAPNQPLLPAAQRYEFALTRLHQMIAEGLGNSSSADQIRTEMEESERDLTEKELDRLDGLSADLYMLRGTEILEPESQVADSRQGIANLIRAFDREEWDTLLRLLRDRWVSAILTEEQRAYLRAQAYEALGLLESAQLFLRYATRLSLTNNKDLWVARAASLQVQ